METQGKGAWDPIWGIPSTAPDWPQTAFLGGRARPRLCSQAAPLRSSWPWPRWGLPLAFGRLWPTLRSGLCSLPRCFLPRGPAGRLRLAAFGNMSVGRDHVKAIRPQGQAQGDQLHKASSPTLIRLLSHCLAEILCFILLFLSLARTLRLRGGTGVLSITIPTGLCPCPLYACQALLPGGGRHLGQWPAPGSPPHRAAHATHLCASRCSRLRWTFWACWACLWALSCSFSSLAARMACSSSSVLCTEREEPGHGPRCVGAPRHPPLRALGSEPHSHRNCGTARSRPQHPPGF